MEILLVLSVIVLGYFIYNEISYGYCLRKVVKFANKSNADIIGILNSSLEVAKVAKYDASILPYLPEELAGANLWDLFTPEIVAKILKYYEEAISGKSIVTTTFTFQLNADNKIQEMEAKFVPLRKGYVACLLRKTRVLDSAEALVYANHESVSND